MDDIQGRCCDLIMLATDVELDRATLTLLRCPRCRAEEWWIDSWYQVTSAGALAMAHSADRRRMVAAA
jgi:hypothetical protein